VSKFEPTTRITLPENQPDLLAESVLDSLFGRTHPELYWPMWKVLLWTLLSFGIVPIFVLMRKLRHLIVHQSQQFWYLAEWLRLAGDSDAAQMQKMADRIQPSLPLAILGAMFVLIAICGAIMQFSPGGFSPRALIRFAYHIPVTPQAMIFTLGLSAAAVCHWAHLASHQHNVERFIDSYNQLLSRRRIDPVPMPSKELGLRPMWIGAGLVLAGLGGLWVLPLMLAAGAHRRYTNVRSCNTRRQLADRFRILLLTQQPELNLPPGNRAAVVDVTA
jgi:hypothetical protein